MGTDYALATGRMLKVFAKCECPVCNNDIEHFDDAYIDGWHHDTYKCDYCKIFVVYITPRRYGEYHLVPDSEKRYEIESFKW